ncbi:MAG: hypothetical protein IJR00_08010 [Lachnospiraceae bacterium]|nr:hypothetical protein [Lachnospiraceae bacterium]
MKVKQFVKEIFRQVKRDWYMPVTEHQIYDTTERVIGTYMGKPLYRKVFEDVAPNTVLVTGVENFVRFDGINQNNVDVVDIGGNLGVSAACFTFSDGTIKFVGAFASGQYMYVNAEIIIIEYTKTTDTASDSKVPFEPLTEYSTEERMIGYWIDGKPLYRKCIETQTPPSTAQAVVYTADANMRIKHLDGLISDFAPVQFYNTAQYNSCVFVDNSGATPVVYQKVMGYTNLPLLLILTYTKTTD